MRSARCSVGAARRGSCRDDLTACSLPRQFTITSGRGRPSRPAPQPPYLRGGLMLSFKPKLTRLGLTRAEVVAMVPLQNRHSRIHLIGHEGLIASPALKRTSDVWFGADGPGLRPQSELAQRLSAKPAKLPQRSPCQRSDTESLKNGNSAECEVTASPRRGKPLAPLLCLQLPNQQSRRQARRASTRCLRGPDSPCT